MARRKGTRELGEDTSMGIDIDGDGKSDFSISLKTIGMVLVGIATLIGMWFTLQSDIQEAKELPAPVIERNTDLSLEAALLILTEMLFPLTT